MGYKTYKLSELVFLFRFSKPSPPFFFFLSLSYCFSLTLRRKTAFLRRGTTLYPANKYSDSPEITNTLVLIILVWYFKHLFSWLGFWSLSLTWSGGLRGALWECGEFFWCLMVSFERKWWRSWSRVWYLRILRFFFFRFTLVNCDKRWRAKSHSGMRWYVNSSAELFLIYLHFYFYFQIFNRFLAIFNFVYCFS